MKHSKDKQPHGQLIVHPAPAGMAGSGDCTVKVNGRPAFVYEITVHDGKAPMVCFDFAGAADVEVTMERPVDSAEVRPRSFGIRATIEGNVIRFRLSQPRKVVLEFNGRRRRALHIFANAPEVDPPRPGSPHVTYFGPGIHEAGVIRLENDQSVYLAGGAYVYGSILGEGVQRARLLGRGILDGSKAGRVNLVNLAGCADIELQGVILLDCQCWVCHIQNRSRNVRIDNLKIVNHYRGGTDGIDINSSQDVRIDDCFIRDCDDKIAIKSFLEGSAGDVRHVHASRCVLWSDGCRDLQNGLETRCDVIEDVVFRDMDIVHHLDITHPVLSICIGDRAVARGIRFEDIRIEDAAGSPLIDVWVGKSYYTLDARHGRVAGITFKNIGLTGGPPPRTITSWGPHADERLLGIYGCADDHAVEDVTIENLHVFGRFAARAEDANIQVREFARNIRFVPPADGSPVASFRTDPATPPGAGQRIVFDASASFAQDGRIVSYRFDFGDGATADGMVAEHRYAAAGHYPVLLAVRDEAGREGRVRTVASVFALRPPSPPAKRERGLTYRCHDIPFTLAGAAELDARKPVRTGQAGGLKASLPESGEQAVLLDGYIDVPQTGVYTFFLDGAVSSLHVGGRLVAEADFLMASWTDWGQVGLVQGTHAFRLACSADGLRRLKVEWEGPGVPLQAVSATSLCH